MMNDRENIGHPPTMEDARQALHQFFGYDDFRSGQVEIIEAILNGRDTIAIMPTGGGKSICYQVPALLLPGLTVVISPLIALMQDQVDTLSRRGIPATYINSHLSHRDVTIRLERARHGAYRLLYVAPERFESGMFLESMKGIPVSLLAVDEAHCVSEWGHDFRPSYLRLREARENLGRPQVAALTATATPEVRRDIQTQLGLTDPVVLVRGFNRPNLTFRVLRNLHKKDFIVSRCLRGESGVVYAGSRSMVEELTRHVQAAGARAEAYHAGLGADQRREAQQRFLNGDSPIIIATTAFGMGIDKPDVRFVIHHDMPQSIEQYYQEAGRAGRDGLPAECIVLYHESDRGLPEMFIHHTYPDRALVQQVYAFLHNEAGTVVGARTEALLAHSSSSIAARLRNAGETAVRNALKLLETNGYVRVISTVYARSTVRFLVSPERMRAWILEGTQPVLTPVALALLRTVGGEAFFTDVDVDIADIAIKSFLDEQHILEGMRELSRQQFIDMKLDRPKSGILLPGVRIQAKDLQIDFRAQEVRKKRQLRKLDALEAYLTGPGCRRNMLLAYFEEKDVQGVCGKCDTCTGESRAGVHREVPGMNEDQRIAILFCVAEVNGKFGRSLLTEILRGAKTRRITEFALFECAMYGRLSGLRAETVTSWIDLLCLQGFLQRSEGTHPTLRITQEGERLLGRPVQPRSLPRRADPNDTGVDDPVLYEALRSVRRKIAQKHDLPTFAIMPDAVLRAVCATRPRDRRALLSIEGVGPATFEKCGKEFLRTIEEYETQRHLTVALELAGNVLDQLSQPVRDTLALAESGIDLETLALRRGLSIGTVSQHLCELLTHGVQLPLDSLVMPDRQMEIRRASRSLRSRELKKIKAVVDPGISFAEIRLMIVLLDREDRRQVADSGSGL